MQYIPCEGFSTPALPSGPPHHPLRPPPHQAFARTLPSSQPPRDWPLPTIVIRIQEELFFCLGQHIPYGVTPYNFTYVTVTWKRLVKSRWRSGDCHMPTLVPQVSLTQPVFHPNLRDVSSGDHISGIFWKGSGIIRPKDCMSKIDFFHHRVDAGGISQSIQAKAFLIMSSCLPAPMPYPLLSPQSLRKVSHDEIYFSRIELIFDLPKCPLHPLLIMKLPSRPELFLEKRGSKEQLAVRASSPHTCPARSSCRERLYRRHESPMIATFSGRFLFPCSFFLHRVLRVPLP